MKNVANQEECKELFDKVNDTYRANEDRNVFNISVTDNEKVILIKESKKHLKDYNKIFDDNTNWMDFINSIIKNIKSSKDSIEFSSYEFIKIRMWLCDLKY